MRGRKPRSIIVSGHDVLILQQISRSRTIPWFQVQRARVILAMGGGERVQTVASNMQCDPSTVWRICRRYEQGGLSDLLCDAPRKGIPMRFPPLQRAEIVQLACLEPIAKGLHITHWTSQDLARQAVKDGIVHTSVRLRCDGFFTRWICNRIVHAIGKPRAWCILNSNSVPRKYFGAMQMLSV